MARDDDPWRRRREREEEEEQRRKDDEAMAARKATPGQRPGAGAAPVNADGGNEKLLELIARAEPMIEQLNNLYNMYFTGAERRPPIERRAQLEQLMQTIQLMSKPTPALQFRCSGLQTSFATFRDRWDRKLKEMEAGKRRS